MFAIKSYEKPEQKPDTSQHPDLKTGEKCRKKFCVKWISLILMTTCLATINTLENVYFNLGATYFQYSPIRLSASTAASVVSVMTASYTIKIIKQKSIPINQHIIGFRKNSHKIIWWPCLSSLRSKLLSDIGENILKKMT